MAFAGMLDIGQSYGIVSIGLLYGFINCRYYPFYTLRNARAQFNITFIQFFTSVTNFRFQPNHIVG
jgi:hypothetical protein